MTNIEKTNLLCQFYRENSEIASILLRSRGDGLQTFNMSLVGNQFKILEKIWWICRRTCLISVTQRFSPSERRGFGLHPGAAQQKTRRVLDGAAAATKDFIEDGKDNPMKMIGNVITCFAPASPNTTSHSHQTLPRIYVRDSVQHNGDEAGPPSVRTSRRVRLECPECILH